MLNNSFNDDRTSSTEPVYSKIQKFYIKNTLGEERSKDLRIIVDICSSYSKVTKQLLNIQVVDDDDPFFYYSLMLTDDDYQRLKSVQGLLVDFEHFPSQVVRLLEQCNQNEVSEVKFLLLLEEERKELPATYLKIVEANDFKHLCHLVLQIEPGNDSDIKKLMMKKIKTLKDSYAKAEKMINGLESQLNNKSKQLQAVEEKLYRVQEEWKEERMAVKAESTKEITEETEKFRKMQLEWQIKSQREKSDLETKYQNLIKEKDTELSRLRVENQILIEKRQQTDMTITDQIRRLEQSDKELATVRSELVNSRKICHKLETEIQEKEKSINNYKTRIAVAEQESKDKTILMAKHQELLNVAMDQKLKLEEVLSEKEKNLQRKQISLKNLSDELIKANEIITKLQKELTVINSKIAIRTSIAMEQEKVVDSYQKTIKKLEEAREIYEKKLNLSSETEVTLKTTISELKDLIETKDKKIKDNERMIDWLNRKLTEQTTKTTASSVNIAQSTPYGRFGSESSARIPFSSRVPSTITNISHLDQLQTPVIPEETENTEPNQNEENKEKSQEKKPPNEKPTMKKATKKSVGLKRISPSQATPVPSSYFLK